MDIPLEFINEAFTLGGVDSDGDGVPDIRDEDDDNDGILDQGLLCHIFFLLTIIVNQDDEDDNGDGISDSQENLGRLRGKR
jgi:hypothetical protein